MKPQDIISINALSRLFTNHSKSIQWKRIPKKHASSIKELTDFVENWIKKNEVKK